MKPANKSSNTNLLSLPIAIMACRVRRRFCICIFW